MAIPVYMQNFRHAGIYRVVFDKSTILNQDTNVLRLLVGYSDKGPFNIPTYVQSASDFISMYGGINKTQERRGNFFHRTALAMLNVSPILVLNLKKFANEQVTGMQIDTNFNANNPIDTVKINVEDIYDTTRFWSLDPEKLNDVRGAEYINIATTDVKQNSGTVFIRKASGAKVAEYQISVRDWYKSQGEDIPDFLQGYENEKISSFFAEAYVFGGKFTADQVLASDTLKNYFTVIDKGADKGKLILRKYVIDSFGDYTDALDALYEDSTSGAIGHYVGCLIPYFKNSIGAYAALDIIFNNDSDAHHMMMSFNEDMLYEDGTANIDLSGARWISTDESTPKDNTHDSKHPLAKNYKQYGTGIVCIKDIWDGTAQTSLLSNKLAPVVADQVEFSTSLYSDGEMPTNYKLQYEHTKKVTGALYVSAIKSDSVELTNVGNPAEHITVDLSGFVNTTDKDATAKALDEVLYDLGAAYKDEDGNIVRYESGLGTYYLGTDAYDKFGNIEGPKKVITSISRDLDGVADNVIALSSASVKCTKEDVYITTRRHYKNPDTLVDSKDDTKTWSVYGSSVTFIPISSNWILEDDNDGIIDPDSEVHTFTLMAPASSDVSLFSLLEKGDQFLCEDKMADMDGDGDFSDEVRNGFYDLCYVQEVGTKTKEVDGKSVEYNYIKFTGKVAEYAGKTVGTSDDTVIDYTAYGLLDADQKYRDIDGNTYNTLLDDTKLAEALAAANGGKGTDWNSFKIASPAEAKKYKKYYENSFRLRKDGSQNVWQYRWNPYKYAAQYTKTEEKTISFAQYNNLDAKSKDYFKPYTLQFVYPVNKVEYSLLNATAKSFCVKNAVGEKDPESWTYVYPVEKEIFFKEADDTEGSKAKAAAAAAAAKDPNATATEADAMIPVYKNTSTDEGTYTQGDLVGYVYPTKNTAIKTDDGDDKAGYIVANESALKYDGKLKESVYAVSKYKAEAYPVTIMGEEYSIDDFKKIALTADEYNAFKDDDAKQKAIKDQYNAPVDVKYIDEFGTESTKQLALAKNVQYTDATSFKYRVSKYIDAAGSNIDTTITKCLVMVSDGLNKEIGTMEPVYLEGYTYSHPKPDGTSQLAKLNWINYQLSALTEYKGLRTGLLNKSEIDYRYVVDGFETFVEAGAKKVLTYLCKEKQSAFCIANFPAVKTFVKCPYSSFTDSKGVFNVQYVVNGYNKKKSHTTAFSLPSDDEGASFVGFYTPLKISDGTIESCVPSAGYVSNLFMNKYSSRHPYDIVAGPNYGAMSVSGLIGPDYNYSSDELNIIEPYGVNCMVYRPTFGTFINANQTAKQTPKSSLSSVNVRELVIYLMDEVEKVLQSYQWEFNNPTVRSKIKDQADAICATIQANGGLLAYKNIMDESNNTPDIIDNEMAVLSTHIEPGRGMGKLVHELTLYRTGQMSSSISIG